jgi:hypothetical protein
MMTNNINNQLNEVRYKLISFEHKRDQLKGLDDLNAGLDILSEYQEDIDIAECDIAAKNLLTTYKRNSIEWIKKMLENCSGAEDETLILIYCKKLMETFEDANEFNDSDADFHHLKLLIAERIIKSLDLGTSIMSGLDKLTIEEWELVILLLASMVVKNKRFGRL